MSHFLSPFMTDSMKMKMMSNGCINTTSTKNRFRSSLQHSHLESCSSTSKISNNTNSNILNVNASVRQKKN